MRVFRNRQSNHDRNIWARSGLNQPLWLKDTSDGIQYIKPIPGLSNSRTINERYSLQSQSEESPSLTIPWRYVLRSKLMQLLSND